MKELSVVVAAQNAQATIRGCLGVLTEQNQEGLAEIIVVDNSSDGTTQTVREEFREVVLIEVTHPALIPELWARGAERSSGQVLAFTTAQFIPDRDWIAQILSHHRSDHAAIGGAIENDPRASLTQWAIYFCRYAAYMLPFTSHTTDQVAGDNAAYKKFVFNEYASLVREGFWEHPINTRLRADGHTLLLTPAIRIRYVSSDGMRVFCRHRVANGRIFGAKRAAAMSGKKRAFYLLTSPLIPLVVLGKIIRCVVSKRRHLAQFVLSLPLLTLFVLCWSWGEFTGYLRGDR
jgi:glycosyltransferase involved in cell wall biosynthesis